jgi:hypothetical protein
VVCLIGLANLQFSVATIVKNIEASPSFLEIDIVCSNCLGGAGDIVARVISTGMSAVSGVDFQPVDALITWATSDADADRLVRTRQVRVAFTSFKVSTLQFQLTIDSIVVGGSLAEIGTISSILVDSYPGQ